VFDEIIANLKEIAREVYQNSLEDAVKYFILFPTISPTLISASFGCCLRVGGQGGNDRSSLRKLIQLLRSFEPFSLTRSFLAGALPRRRQMEICDSSSNPLSLELVLVADAVNVSFPLSSDRFGNLRETLLVNPRSGRLPTVITLTLADSLYESDSLILSKEHLACSCIKLFLPLDFLFLSSQESYTHSPSRISYLLQSQTDTLISYFTAIDSRTLFERSKFAFAGVLRGKCENFSLYLLADSVRSVVESTIELQMI